MKDFFLVSFFVMGCPEQVQYTVMDGHVFTERGSEHPVRCFGHFYFPTSPSPAFPSLVKSLQYCLQQIIFHAAHKPHHPLW